VAEAHHAATTARLLLQPPPDTAAGTGDQQRGDVNEPNTSTSSPGLLDAMSEADAAYVMSLITHAIMG